MALIVEDGTGLTTAESYASVADATTYHASFGNTDWAASTTGEQEIALRKATAYLDQVYSDSWIGNRKTAEQALDWPRVYAYDTDGYLIDDDVVPIQVKKATYEAALRVIQGLLLTPDITSSESDITFEKVQVGPISIAQSFQGGKSEAVTFPVIAKILNKVTNGSGGSVMGRG